MGILPLEIYLSCFLEYFHHIFHMFDQVDAVGSQVPNRRQDL